jgi:hypothetical protein
MFSQLLINIRQSQTQPPIHSKISRRLAGTSSNVTGRSETMLAGQATGTDAV